MEDEANAAERERHDSAQNNNNGNKERGRKVDRFAHNFFLARRNTQEQRKSDMTMADAISVEEAIRRVIESSHTMEETVCRLDDENLLGSVLVRAVTATSNIPVAPTSIMDGFAVIAPLSAGLYNLCGEVLAGGRAPSLAEGEGVCYITTGAQLPAGANAVVKVEDTERVEVNGRTMIRIKVDAVAGQHVRQIGSDIGEGQQVLAECTTITPTELGLLASIGCAEVHCRRKPVVGVLSTGNELVDPWKPCSATEVRDSNRISLLSAFKEAGYRTVDLGIAKDTMDDVRSILLQSTETCDVVVSSGGVSMGVADFVKPLLREIGTIHFSKLNMKPGKPTTFATFSNPQKKMLFFGLPGNPVSCLVGASLFVLPALKRMQGLPAHLCLHPQVRVQVVDDLVLDPERPEYHRAEIFTAANGTLSARSTGNQRSSRLLSMHAANALLVLPQGPGVVKAGSHVLALVVRPLVPPPLQSVPTLVHPSAALIDSRTAQLDTSNSSSAAALLASQDADDWTRIRVGLLTISDRASRGVYADESGPTMAKLLTEMSQSENYPLTFFVANTAIVPDEAHAIASTVCAWSEPGSALQVDVILTSGGTGFGSRDLTPEALKPILHREAPGIAQALLDEGLKHTPLALLSRPIVGTRHKTFVATLPGSVKAVKENIASLKALLPRICELLKTDDCNPRFNK